PRAMESIQVDVVAVLGRSEIKISNLLKVGRGAVIELDRRIEESIELEINSQPVARGDIIVVDDALGVIVTKILRRTGA
ncbi:MAG: FliM/FliN family flagellar motor switch protein, partial [Pseudomonadota bacterium]